MTRILIICLVLFPVVFMSMLFMTGTLQDVVIPQLKARFGASQESGGQAEAPLVRDAVDSLLVAAADLRGERAQAALDSLEAVRARMETEREELSRLGEEVRSFVERLEALETTVAEKRIQERRALAKIFGEMDPERAAQILNYLDTESVTFLVKAMQKRQAAEVLAMLDPEVAAFLSENIMHGPEATP